MPRAKRAHPDANSNIQSTSSKATGENVGSSNSNKKRKSKNAQPAEVQEITEPNPTSNAAATSSSVPSRQDNQVENDQEGNGGDGQWDFVALCSDAKIHLKPFAPPVKDSEGDEVDPRKDDGETEDEEESEDEDDNDDDDDSDAPREPKKKKPCVCNKPYLAQSHDDPTHVWYTTKNGMNMLIEWIKAAQKTNPDAFGMYIYNDFHSYGLLEIMENMFLDLDTQLRKRKDHFIPEIWVIPKLWATLEAAGIAVTSGFAGHWTNVDDGIRASEVLKLWGVAILNAIKLLIEGDLFHRRTKSPIKNISTVVGRFVNIGRDWSDTVGMAGLRDELHWVRPLIEICEKHDVPIEGGSSISKSCDKFRKEGTKSKTTIGSEAFWKAWAWTKHINKYKKNYAHMVRGRQVIGGEEFDITAWTPAERQQYSHSHEDPLEGIDDV